jgi:Zn-dependent M28 family amino/carboxypeptidase
MTRLASFVVLLAAGTTAAVAGAAAPHAFSPQIAGDDFSAHVRVLASDEYAGRDPVTPGEDKTIAYLTAQLERLGLQPGYGDSFVQQVPFQLRLGDNANSLASVAAGGRLRSLEVGDDAVLGSDQGKPEVTVSDSPMVFLGYGIDAPEKGWNDFADVDLTGKTAVFLAGEPDGEQFDGRLYTIHSRSGLKFEHAARRGAVAALVIHDTQAAGYDWTGVKLRWHGREFALLPGDRNVAPLAVQGWLSADAGKAVFATAGVDLRALREAAGKAGFRAVPLGEATFAATLKGKVLHGRSRNVLAKLPGTTRPDEAVLYSAHWDHLGTQPGKSGDDIWNGALDNATGVAAVLEIAERYATTAPRPARSVLFFFPTLEELGLLGSAYYTRHPAVPMARTVADINFDLVVPIGRPRNFVAIGYGLSELDALLAPIVAARNRPLAGQRENDIDSFLRSDHLSFARAGVPVLYLRGGTENEGTVGRDSGGGAADQAFGDRAIVYHTPDDEFDPGWDTRSVVEDLGIAYDVGRTLAEGEAWPNWHADTPFRAVRDASRAVQP